LKGLAAALAAFLGAAAGIPLVGAALAPGMRRDEPQWVAVGALTDFAVGQPKMVTFGVAKADGYLRTTATRAVWVLRPSADQVVVYNARCTHLGCLVDYRSGARTFSCPSPGNVACPANTGSLQPTRARPPVAQ
jgi:nitrite reductase/ring-hydroxylating ferredoxin subunit